jgi:aminomethyltransferase
MVPFAGWEMPVQYPQGILAEARAVRSRSGIFDVSHMGRLFVEGADAQALLNWVHTGDIGLEMPLSRARYGLLCNEDGGIIDDCIIYRLSEQRYLLVANASNTPEVLTWVTRWRDERFPNVTLDDATNRIAMIALQGPDAVAVMATLSDFDPAATRQFRIVEATIQGKPALIGRTGYTGEDGVEIMQASEDATWLWGLLMDHGAMPAGLGARDVLRLEASLPLHGNDISPKTNPLEAGLERFLALDKGDFCGAVALRAIQASGQARQLVGFQTVEKGALPRAHSSIVIGGQRAGEVSSGGYSPTLDRNIGLGYVPAQSVSPGSRIQVDVRGNLIDAEVVRTPFYSRPR